MVGQILGWSMMGAAMVMWSDLRKSVTPIVMVAEM
jgi:hypothetical protein